MRRTPTGIASLHAGRWFVVERPDGRQGRRLFGSRLRAAEHAMRAYRVPNWTLLQQKGVRVVAWRGGWQ